MKRHLIIGLMFLMLVPYLHATHNRAGEITLVQVSDFTYRILIQTFTYSRSAADRDNLEVQWGDGTTSTAPRISKVSLPNFYFWNRYETTHTFPGPGTYTIVVEDPNRNFGVLNIPNSVNVIFSVKTTVIINPQLKNNSTPVLLNPPIDRAAIGQVFVHNPSAFDIDGDSISYKLIVCSEEAGQPIQDYTLPIASDSIYVNPVTGDLIWDTPVDSGIYNIAIEIEEWRNRVKIGSIARDMQIDVFSTNNKPPVIMPLRSFCVEAGEFLQYDIIATDPDSDRINLQATGGPFYFSDSRAVFDTLVAGRGYAASRFNWLTTCEHIRDQPYNITVKAEDDDPELPLVDIANFQVKVLGPAPKNPLTSATASSIQVSWTPPDCDNVSGYILYRKEGQGAYTPDSCVQGLPNGLGYASVAILEGRDQTSYLDDDEGRGLIQGTEYCYRVVAIYGEGTLGYPSVEACDVLIPGTPVMLQASVTNVDAVNGEVFLSWAKPGGLDTIPATGPYEYVLYRSDLDAFGNNLVQIHSFTTADLNDTTYLDEGLDTESYPYSYVLELYNDEPGNRFLIGRQEVVSTTWLEIESSDNLNRIRIRKNTPWVNIETTIYRKDPAGITFDSIGFTDNSVYEDAGLRNGIEYCYQVRTRGWRSAGGRTYLSENLSHLACGTPVDNVPPCPPELSVTSSCDSSYNFLQWTNPNHSCADDVVKYRIYYSPLLDANVQLIDSTLSAEDTSYFHFLETSLAACYAVTAVDSFNNESDFSVIACVDDCIDYVLPNVFTPNGDGINDFFRPSSYSFVEKVDMKIFNRWGTLVYQTDDPDINWDGKRMNDNTLVPPGVYYYVCDVFETRLTGTEIRNIVGFVYLFTEADASNDFLE